MAGAISNGGAVKDGSEMISEWKVAKGWQQMGCARDALGSRYVFRY
jgi:hypothetical protein